MPDTRQAGSTQQYRLQRPEQERELVKRLHELMDSTLSGGRLKFLTVIDEFSRSCLAIKVEGKLTSTDVVAEPERLITRYGSPSFIRCDNGPEFIAQAPQQLLATAKIKTLLIDSSPWQNGYCESFNSRFRDELLNLDNLHLYPLSPRAQPEVATRRQRPAASRSAWLPVAETGVGSSS